ncbi:MAG: hypothetical protein HY658_11605 [Actinobacteria bacterium]|nr:hypothetical protein [Actinomycetota bacterium]
MTGRLRGLRLGDERGATAALVAISLAAVLGMLVLVVDLGGMLTMRRRMVAGTDAAALAAAQSCALGETGDAGVQASSLTAANEPAAAVTSFETVGCTGESSGSARVSAQAPIDLFFAPILGLGDEGTVGADARAIWGPAGGTSPVPIEFAIDPATGVFPCAYQALGTQCSYWFDNSADHDLADSSNWGFMNLGAWGVSAEASCPNAGSSDRREWITGGALSNVVLTRIPTLVCVDSGHSTSNWFAALADQIGRIKHFPINDPSSMVTTSGKEKYAIVGFAALQVEEVLKGNDPAAVGVPGQGGSCSTSHDFAPLSTLDLDAVSGGGCPGGTVADQVTGLELSKKVKGVTTVFQEGLHYDYDPTSHVVTWRTGNEPAVQVKFDWAVAGTPGLCGIRPPDPNGVCLVASWQGAQVGGTNPGLGGDFGLRAIRLDD